jgi:hypothetical protein
MSPVRISSSTAAFSQPCSGAVICLVIGIGIGIGIVTGIVIGVAG